MSQRGAVPADQPRVRKRMVDALRKLGIADERVLAAMGEVPRHLFIPEALRAEAYTPEASIPIGHGQTISQPLTVARMTAALLLEPQERVLEVGTGSGYQTAVLARLARRVYSVERLRPLSERAEALLKELGARNVLCHVSDGTLGWKEQGPFDAILVTAGGPRVPAALVEQLAENGRLIAPVGERGEQRLVRVRRRGGVATEEIVGSARFVDLVGQDGWPDDAPGSSSR